MVIIINKMYLYILNKKIRMTGVVNGDTASVEEEEDTKNIIESY